MGLTGVYNAPISETDGISIIKHAFDKGITFFDTADVYGDTTNEVLVGKVYALMLLNSLQVEFLIVTTLNRSPCYSFLYFLRGPCYGDIFHRWPIKFSVISILEFYSV